MKSTKRKVFLGLLIVLGLLIAPVLSQILYSITIPVQMKLKTTENVVIEKYELELRNSNGKVSNLNFGDFNEGETKKIYAELHNTGNTNLAVYWYADVPSSWHLDIIYFYESGSNPWPSLEKKPIAPQDHIDLQFWLTELDANPAVFYSFELVFETSA